MIFTKIGEFINTWKMNKEINKKWFTEEDLQLWYPYVDSYFLDILNGDYDLATAREDLKSLVGSKWDSRTKHIENEG
jgi:hypothetical protein